MAESEGILSTGRRRFLKWATGVSAFLSAALAGIPVLRAFVSPTFRRTSSETWIKLGDVETFDLDIPTKVDFVETVTDAWVENRMLRGVWVYTEDGENFTVFSGRCTHLGCGYAFEKVTGHFKCPCHEGVFDLKTGAATLTRFYAFHVLWLPLLLGGLVLLHLALVIRQGIAPRPVALEQGAPARTTDAAYAGYYKDAYAKTKRGGVRFWPDIVGKDALVALGVVAVLVD